MLWTENILHSQIGGTEAELSSLNFVEFVKNLLKNPQKREDLFQVSFVVHFCLWLLQEYYEWYFKL